MAIVTFWNESRKESGQTTSILAIATNLAIERNQRVLLIDANFDDNTIEKAFFKTKQNKALRELAQGKLDISSGAEGLLSVIASNKLTPEIITNYTKVVFKNRLDVLTGLKETEHTAFEESLSKYRDMLVAANKIYDLVLVDLEKTMKYQYIKDILQISDIIMYSFPPNMINIDNFLNLKMSNEVWASKKVMPLLSRSDEESSFNTKNVTRYVGEKKLICTVPYHVRFMEAVNQGGAADFFAKSKLSTNKYDINQHFLKNVKRTSEEIIERIKLLNTMRMSAQ